MKGALKFGSLIMLISYIIGCSSEVIEPSFDCTTSDLALASSTIVDSDCDVDNGSATLLVSGGLEPYLYVLNGGSAQSENSFSSIGAGDHLYEVTDANGCAIEGVVTVENATGVNATVSTTESGCGESEGSITVMATGGPEPYSYRLGAGPAQADPKFSALEQGVYTITVSDNDGCSTVLSTTVNSGISFAGAVEPIIQANCIFPNCHGGNPSLPDFRNFSELKNARANVKAFTQSGFMPRNGSLTAAEKQAIACWVDDGAPNN